MSFIEKHVPCECTFAKEDKNKCEAGRKPRSDKEYLKFCAYVYCKLA